MLVYGEAIDCNIRRVDCGTFQVLYVFVGTGVTRQLKAMQSIASSIYYPE